MKAEFGTELEALMQSFSRKIQFSGIDVSPPQFSGAVFYKAYATVPATSRIAMDVAWDTGGAGVYVSNFYLTFNCDGVHSFLWLDMPLSQYEQEREVLADMIEISFDEACSLIAGFSAQLYLYDLSGLGKFLYQKYLNHGQRLSLSRNRL